MRFLSKTQLIRIFSCVLLKNLYHCINEWALKVRLNIEGVLVTVIPVYAPTGDSNREVKVEYFAKLQETFGSVVRGDVLIVTRDLNARVGNGTEVWG